MITTLLKATFNFICGTSETKPESLPPQKPQQYQQHYPQPHQQQQHSQQQHQQQQWRRPPGGENQYQSHEPQHHVQQQQQRRPPRPNKDQNFINSRDPYYVSLRSQANEAAEAMAQCFEESHQAYARGDHALAKELSNEGKEHQRLMEDLNKKASDWIFVENNKDSKPHEVDLHRLFVKEAITYTERALEQARARGDKEVHLIVGKGLHSKDGIAKLKPAIEELIQKHQLSAHVDPNNSGVLIVQLDSAHDRGVGADELTHHIDSRDNNGISEQARARGDKEVHLTVVKGLHPKNGTPKPKPAIEELMQKHQLSTHLDPNNGGVLIDQLDSARDRDVGADELTHHIESCDNNGIRRFVFSFLMAFGAF